MEPDITPAPPEAGIIKTARDAAGMSIQAAADRSREIDPEGNGVSAVYWGNIERGIGGRRGRRVKATASAMKLALMAATVGAEPAELAAAGRGDAVLALETILRRQHIRPGIPARRRGAPIRREDLPPVLQDIDLEALADAIEKVDADIAEFKPWADKYEADTWRNSGLSLDGKRVMIAMYRNLRYGGAAGAGRARSG